MSAYSLIRTADGGEKRIENMAPGDSVAVVGHGSITQAQVKDVWSGPGVGMFRLVVENGALLDLTEDQEIVTEAGLVQANTVRPGMLLSVHGAYSKCVEATRLLGDFMVYDVVVSNSTSEPLYLSANGFAVAAINK